MKTSLIVLSYTQNLYDFSLKVRRMMSWSLFLLWIFLKLVLEVTASESNVIFFFLAFITLLTGNGMRGGQHAAKCHRLDSNSGLLRRRQGLCSWDVCWTTRTMILLLQKVHFLSSTLRLRLQSSYLPAKWLNGLLSHTPSMSGLTAVCSFRGKIMTQTRFSLKINKLYSNKVNFTWSKTFIFFQ